MTLIKNWERVIQELSWRSRHVLKLLPLKEPRAFGDFSTLFSLLRDTDNSPKNISTPLRAFPVQHRRRLVTEQGLRPVLQGVCQRAE